jgi:HK97 family phage major capsid protein
MPISRDSAKKLREERHELTVSMRKLADKIHDEKRDFTAEERTNWDALNADYNQRTRRIEIEERAIELDDASRNPVDAAPPGREDRSGRKPADKRGNPKAKPGNEDRALAVQAWMRRQLDLPLSRKHLAAAERCKIRPSQRTLAIDLDRDYRQIRADWHRENRAMSASAIPDGTAVIPRTMLNQFEKALLDFSGVRQVADVLRTASGEHMEWPTANDTGNEGELVGENTAASEQNPSFGKVAWGSNKCSSKLIKVPVEWLEDALINGPAELGAMLGERIGRKENRELTLGTGGNTAKGIVQAASVGKTTAGATAITFDEVIDLIHSVDPAYRIGPDVGFMMHDLIVAYVRKLKNSTTNEYLWEASQQVGVPDRLKGYPVWINQHMQSTVVTATRTMIFGKLSKYKIRDVGQLRLRRLTERFADSDQEGFVAFHRFDGNLLDAGTGPVKCMLQT